MGIVVSSRGTGIATSTVTLQFFTVEVSAFSRGCRQLPTQYRRHRDSGVIGDGDNFSTPRRTHHRPRIRHAADDLVGQSSWRQGPYPSFVSGSPHRAQVAARQQMSRKPEFPAELAGWT